MAKRRMFSLDIIDTDIFIEMPQSSRLLYYELCMRADDDGFVSSPKKIMKMAGCSEDDFKVLISKQFVIPFNTGIIVIKHWRIHNYIQKDRYKETIYKYEKSLIQLDKNDMYTLCIQNGYSGKDSLELELKEGKSNYTHTYTCHLKKEEKDSFCLDCQKKLVCKNKTSDSFIKIYGMTLEEYSKDKSKNRREVKELFDYDWLEESEGDENY